MRRTVRSIPVIVLLSLFGCEKEEHSERAAEPAASVDKASAVDPALAKAMAQASANAGPKRGPVQNTGGPPESGVFEPGAADREARRGAPPKITLGDRGAEPRVALGPIRPKPGWKSAGSAQIMMQQGQSGLPVQIALSLEAQKAKTDADAGAPSGADSDVVAVTARVKAAEISTAGAPEEIASKVRALKGAKVDYQIMKDGSGTAYHYDLPSGATDVVDILRILSDALALVTFPVPDVPLGQGAFWMTTSREGVFGLDLVTYRMIKVEKVAGDAVTLSVGTKRYSASSRFDFAGLPPDAPRELLEFDAKSDGRVDFKRGTPFPTGGDISSLLGAKLGTPPQVGVIQIQSRVALSFPDKAGAAAPKAQGATAPAP